MLERPFYLERLAAAVDRSPVTALLGPRQCGRTTLARRLTQDRTAEIKFNEAPRITPSMRAALEDLRLDHLWVVYPGQHSYPVHAKITVWPLQRTSEIRNLL